VVTQLANPAPQNDELAGSTYPALWLAQVSYTSAMSPIRFTLRELLFSVTLVAVGAAGLRLAFFVEIREIGRPLDGAQMLMGWFGGGMSIGAAITGLWRHDWLLGAGVGLAIQFVLLLALTGAY
jgi:hypothetical protein